MISGKIEKFYNCSACDFKFSNLDVSRVCSNCFACTGCEVYHCPACGVEVVVKPMKAMNNLGSA